MLREYDACFVTYFPTVDCQPACQNGALCTRIENINRCFCRAGTRGQSCQDAGLLFRNVFLDVTALAYVRI